jgi:7,8-dihydropterin-6-yl-methyl-4-(beta-D-ribofuranosyl)aminobenzene 5'-phosphate synthase
MSFKIHPVLWPICFLGSPLIIPMLIKKNKAFDKNKKRASSTNKKRIEQAKKVMLPELEYAQLKVIVEHKAKNENKSDPGVSYLFDTNKGSLLYDIGFGGSNNNFEDNIISAEVDQQKINAIAISHFHPDHCGGMKASKNKMINLPNKFASVMRNRTCYIPEKGNASDMKTIVIDRPQILCAGIASTGPLARGLFFFGWTEEQALVFNIKNKGLVIFTGCGHPTLEVIIEMVKKISDTKIYAIGGGLHFPIKNGRGNYLGVQVQRIIGTGKKPWENISEEDLKRTISTINESGAEKVFLSPHDSCDYSLNILEKGLNTKTYILTAGETYKL